MASLCKFSIVLCSVCSTLNSFSLVLIASCCIRRCRLGAVVPHIHRPPILLYRVTEACGAPKADQHLPVDETDLKCNIGRIYSCNPLTPVTNIEKSICWPSEQRTFYFSPLFPRERTLQMQRWSRIRMLILGRLIENHLSVFVNTTRGFDI